MRAMRPHGKLELEQQLVRGQTLGVTGTPELAANLAELARPVGHNKRSSGIDQVRVVETAGTIETSAHKPAPRDLVIRGNVESRGSRKDMHRLLGAVPDVFETSHKCVVNRAPQGLPPQRCVASIQLIDQPLSHPRLAGPKREA